MKRSTKVLGAGLLCASISLVFVPQVRVVFYEQILLHGPKTWRPWSAKKLADQDSSGFSALFATMVDVDDEELQNLAKTQLGNSWPASAATLGAGIVSRTTDARVSSMLFLASAVGHNTSCLGMRVSNSDAQIPLCICGPTQLSAEERLALEPKLSAIEDAIRAEDPQTRKLWRRSDRKPRRPFRL